MAVDLSKITDKEWVALEATVKLSQVFKDLGEHHPSDMGDFVFHLHAIQALIMKRPTIRSYPQYFTHMEPTKE